MTLQLHKNNESEELPFIEKGGLYDRYTFFQLHFHWGSNDRRGSEHRIANKKFVVFQLNFGIQSLRMIAILDLLPNYTSFTLIKDTTTLPKPLNIQTVWLFLPF